MVAVTTGAEMAHAQLARLEAEGKLDEGLRYEVLNGELVIRGSPAVRHERSVRALMKHFALWIDEHGGDAFDGVGIEIGGQQLVPDLAFIGPERAGELDEDGFHVPPGLVVEVTSPGTRSLDLTEKREAYADIGVPEYWVVDLERGVVIVHRRDAADAYQPTELAEGTLATDLAPGLEIPVAELFPGG